MMYLSGGVDGIDSNDIRLLMLNHELISEFTIIRYLHLITIINHNESMLNHQITLSHPWSAIINPEVPAD